MLKAIMNKCMKECDTRGASTIVFPAIGTGNLGFPIDTAANIMVNEVCDYLKKNKCQSLSMVYFIIFMENMYRTFCDKLEMRKQAELAPTKTVTRTQPKKKETKRQQKYRGRRYDTTPQGKYTYAECAAKSSDSHTLDLSNGIQIDVVKGDITQEETDVIVNTTDDQMSLGGGVGAALARQGGRSFEEACRKVKTSKKKGLREGKVIETKAGNLHCKCVFHIMFQKHNFVEVISACIEIACKNQHRSIAFPAIGTGIERFPIDEAAKGMIKGLEKSRPSFNMSVRIVLKGDVHSKFIAAISSQPSWFQRTIGTLGSLMSWGQSTSADDSNEEPMEICELVDIELRIYGETRESVKSAEDSIHELISRQFKAETFDDDRISLLQPSEEKLLRSEAHRKQIIFRIDRNLNSIELKGSKEGISEMKLRIIATLSKLKEETSRRAQAETMMKAVQWHRQDSNDTPYDALTNLEIEEEYHTSGGRSSYTFKDVKSKEHFTIDFPTMVEKDHAMGKEYKVRRITIGNVLLLHLNLVYTSKNKAKYRL